MTCLSSISEHFSMKIIGAIFALTCIALVFLFGFYRAYRQHHIGFSQGMHTLSVFQPVNHGAIIIESVMVKARYNFLHHELSSALLRGFHDFLEKMRNPAAADLVKSIKQFLGNFAASPADLRGDTVQQFLEQMEATFPNNQLWRTATDEELQAACEGLEKYVMTKLHASTFAVLQEDRDADAHLTMRIQALTFLKPEHLDIQVDFRSEQSWLLAQNELLKINQYKAPRDKLVCVLNCCRVISNLLNVAAAGGQSGTGADDFLPVLIYVVVKAAVPALCSNLEYIMRFRLASRLRSEALYYYTNIVSAVTFIRTMTPEQLSGVEPGEFHRAMTAAGIVAKPPIPHTSLIAPTDPPTPACNAVSTPTLNRPLPALSPLTPAQGAEGASTPKSLFQAVSSGLTLSAPPSLSQKNMQAVSNPVEIEMEASGPAQTTNPPDARNESSGAKAESTNRNSKGEVDNGPVLIPLPTLEQLEELGMRSVVASDSSGQLPLKYRYLYANAGDLRMVDVANLLTEHKELILKYETLRQGVLALYQPQPVPENPSSSATQPADFAPSTEKDTSMCTEMGERNHASLGLGMTNAAGSQPSSAYPSPPVSIASLDTCNLQLESAHDLVLPSSTDLREVEADMIPKAEPAHGRVHIPTINLNEGLRSSLNAGDANFQQEPTVHDSLDTLHIPTSNLPSFSSANETISIPTPAHHSGIDSAGFARSNQCISTRGGEDLQTRDQMEILPGVGSAQRYDESLHERPVSTDAIICTSRALEDAAFTPANVVHEASQEADDSSLQALTKPMLNNDRTVRTAPFRSTLHRESPASSPTSRASFEHSARSTSTSASPAS